MQRFLYRLFLTPTKTIHASYEARMNCKKWGKMGKKFSGPEWDIQRKYLECSPDNTHVMGVLPVFVFPEQSQ